MDELGRVDVLVNNAGIYEAQPVLETSYEEWQRIWRRTIDTNLLGPANLIHAVAPHMVAAGGGRIVNVSSRGRSGASPATRLRGQQGGPEQPGAVDGAGPRPARDLRDHGRARVRGDRHGRPVPGRARRRRHPRPEPPQPGGDPEEVARVVVFLATPGTESLTGAVVDVNGASYLRT